MEKKFPDRTSYGSPSSVESLCVFLSAYFLNSFDERFKTQQGHGFDALEIASVAHSCKILLPFVRGFERANRKLPAEVKSLSENYERRVIAGNMAVLREVTRLAEHFESARIPFVVFKGPLQQKMLYDDYFIRPSGDIDVLVPPSFFHPAMDSLESLGFQAIPGSNALWWDRFLGERHLVRSGQAAATVDLHHRLQQPGSPQPKRIAAFLAEKRTTSFRGKHVPVLSRGHTALLCAMSLVKAFFNREPAAGHACDLLVALGGADQNWVDDLLEDARRQDVEGTAFLALRFVEAVFGVSYHVLDDRRAAILPELSVLDLQTMIAAPHLLASFPSRRRILKTACAGDRLSYVRETGWMALSDLTRRLGERPRIRSVGERTTRSRYPTG